MIALCAIWNLFVRSFVFLTKVDWIDVFKLFLMAIGCIIGFLLFAVIIPMIPFIITIMLIPCVALKFNESVEWVLPVSWRSFLKSLIFNIIAFVGFIFLLYPESRNISDLFLTSGLISNVLTIFLLMISHLLELLGRWSYSCFMDSYENCKMKAKQDGE